MTFFVSAPIFVFREFHRHRAGWCVTGDTEITMESEGGRLARGVSGSVPAAGATGGNRLPVSVGGAAWHAKRTGGRPRYATGPDPPPRSVGTRAAGPGSQRGDHALRRAPILDVTESGVKEVLALRTEGRAGAAVHPRPCRAHQRGMASKQVTSIPAPAGRHGQARRAPGRARHSPAALRTRHRRLDVDAADAAHQAGRRLLSVCAGSRRGKSWCSNTWCLWRTTSRALWTPETFARPASPVIGPRPTPNRLLARREVTAGAKFVRYERGRRTHRGDDVRPVGRGPVAQLPGRRRRGAQLLQRGERPLPRAPPRLLRAGRVRQARPEGPPGQVPFRRRHSRAAPDGSPPVMEDSYRRPTRPTGRCCRRASRAKSRGRCCPSVSTRRCTRPVMPARSCIFSA